MATAIPFAAELGTYAKYGDLLLDGIDALMGLGETTPIVGIRQEFDHDLGDPDPTIFFDALIDGAEDHFPVTRLWVHEGSLMIGEHANQLRNFRDASYVLFSIRSAIELSYLDSLPLHGTADSIIKLAASPDNADWQRAKAGLWYSCESRLPPRT